VIWPREQYPKTAGGRRTAPSVVQLGAEALGDLVQPALVTLDLVGQSDHFLEVGVGALGIGINGTLQVVEALINLVEALRHLAEALLHVAEQVLECGLHRLGILPRQRQRRKPYMLLRYWPPTS